MSQTPKNCLQIYSFLLIALLIRIFLATRSSSNGIKQWIQSRVEISTPLTSWSRVLEGIYLKSMLDGPSSYQGDLVHEIPLMLRIYQIFLSLFGERGMFILFCILDTLNGFILYTCSSKIIQYLINLEQLNLKNGKYMRLKSSETFLLSEKTFNKNVWALFALAIYLFNPFGLASCLAQSTVIFHNFILLSWLYFMLEGSNIFSLFSLALHAHITVYSFILIVPTLCFLRQRNFYYVNKYLHNRTQFYVSNFFIYAILCAGIFVANLALENFNTRFIECTYLFILKVPDLVPNMGVFWYFFTEMFDHFLVFFTFVFQLNTFLYSVPLTIRLKDEPMVNILLQISLLTVLKSYPNVSETSFYLALLVPIIAYSFPLMRNFLVYSCMLLAATVLAPIMFYLWLGSGGGNANFYFAITLVYSTGQLFLIADLLYAHLKREFIKLNGEEWPIDVKTKTNALFALE
jgi:phosphatidylinositol glycan class U